jgi:hypothetical protein
MIDGNIGEGPMQSGLWVDLLLLGATTKEVVAYIMVKLDFWSSGKVREQKESDE